MVLADDAGRRALPVWLRGHPGGRSLSELPGRADSELVTGGVPEELAARLLHAAGATVTGVDVDVTTADADELDPDACTALVQLGGPAGPGQIPVPFGLGLAVAAEAGAPVRVADPVLDRWSVPVPGDDLLGPFLDRVPAVRVTDRRAAGRHAAAHAPGGCGVRCTRIVSSAVRFCCKLE